MDCRKGPMSSCLAGVPHLGSRRTRDIPLSIVPLMDVAKIADEARRAKLASLMARLSQGSGS